MNGNCRVFPSLEHQHNRLSSLHDRPELSIGIIDTSTSERLATVLDWYTRNLDQDINVMTVEGQVDLASFQQRYPTVTFIVFAASSFNGEKINQFAYACHARTFLIVRSDCDLVYYDGASIAALMGTGAKPAMLCPLRLNQKGEVMGDVRLPLLENDGIAVGADMPSGTRPSPTLYPVMGMGLYDTALFQRLRGYDEQIHSEFWQALDWGIRCWTLGYTIQLVSSMVFYFPGALQLVEDVTRTEGWRRCETKALGVRANPGGKNAVVRPRQGFDRDAFEQEVRQRLRWLVKTDYPTLVRQWGKDA